MLVRYGGILVDFTLLTLKYWKCGRWLQANHLKGFPVPAHWFLNTSGHMSENKSVRDVDLDQLLTPLIQNFAAQACGVVGKWTQSFSAITTGRPMQT